MVDDKKTKDRLYVGSWRSQLFRANSKISVIVISRKKRSKELVSGLRAISGVWNFQTRFPKVLSPSYISLRVDVPITFTFRRAES